MERDRPHLLLRGQGVKEGYRRPPQAIEAKVVPRPLDPAAHGAALKAEYESVVEAASPELTAHRRGTYVVFESFPDVELALESLDPRVGKAHPELVAVRELQIAEATVTQATVYIPPGQSGYFLKRLDKYVESVETDSPRSRDLVERIQSIRMATLEQIWTDPTSQFPRTSEPVWWEVWLRRSDGHELERLHSFVRASDSIMGDWNLTVLDRIVVLVRATPDALSAALDVLDDLAELRRPRPRAEMVATESAIEQADWVAELQARTVPAGDSSPAVTLLDTGAHQAHPLLQASLAAEDCHACVPGWGVADHSGHGTEMAGVALFGDLGEALIAGHPIRLTNRLESVKLIPPVGATPEELYGAITADATSRVEIQAPNRKRVFSMAITVDLPPQDALHPEMQFGQPTSWSAAVDALAAGQDIDVSQAGSVALTSDGDRNGRLFVVAAGNIDEFDDDWLERCDLQPVEDPGQAWNALTVGAFTDLTIIDPNEGTFDGWTPLAPAGELSPSSRTSVGFERSWPPKPDVVLEGGNVARSPAGTDFDWPYSFQRLTTRRPSPGPRLLTVTRQTSAATAEAAHLAAGIMADYPEIWPETVRALIVHSAEWTPAMRARFEGARLRGARDSLRRRYGMGVPDLDRAVRSATDALTLVVEDTIRPFDGHGRMREMNLHEIPWPRDVLQDLGGVTVTMRVTLSYFVQPNPARRGWVRRYSYASHGLRFEVRRPTESTDDFRKRINKLALAEDESRPRSAATDAADWFFGPDLRGLGSIHSDTWTGTAADLADRGAVAIYPIGGWWKERPAMDRSEAGARYALVISINTPGQDVDIWTPVANLVGIPVHV
jgi:Subtilase family